LALRSTSVASVGLYADFPYIARYGWASWITGLPAEKYLRPDVWLASELGHIGLADMTLRPDIVELTPGERERKRVAITKYTSQLSALGLDEQRLALRRNALHYEVRWAIPSSVLPLAIENLGKRTEYTPSEDETGPKVGHW
jgi:hypothetical protein